MESHRTDGSHSFIPAAGADWLLPLYDPLCRLMGTARHRERLIDAVPFAAGDRVLDLGCGTGALSLQIARRRRDVRATGLDPDAKALARARAKASRLGVEVAWREGFADALPFADASFERVVSSLMFHHLTHAGRVAALGEVARVLAPGGTVHVLDFGPPRGAWNRLVLHAFHHGADHMDDNLQGRIPDLMRDAGLADAGEEARMGSVFGALSLWSARR